MLFPYVHGGYDSRSFVYDYWFHVFRLKHSVYMCVCVCVYMSLSLYFTIPLTEYRPDDVRTTKLVSRTNKIILNFHLYGLEDTDRIVSVRVVFKHPVSLPLFKATAYEMRENGLLTMLDLQVSNDGWIDLNVQDLFELHKEDKTRSKSDDYRLPLDKEHRVVLELAQLNSASGSDELVSFLHSINPFIAVYTYDKEVYEHLSGGSQLQRESSHIGRAIRKRQVTSTMEERNQTFADLYAGECQLRRVNITIEQLGFFSKAYEVILPYWLNFTFCYGRCNREVNLLNNDKFSIHAKTLKLLKPDLAEAGVAPSCAASRRPEDTTSVQVILLSGNVTETTTIPLVQSCLCQ